MIAVSNLLVGVIEVAALAGLGGIDGRQMTSGGEYVERGRRGWWPEVPTVAKSVGTTSKDICKTAGAFWEQGLLPRNARGA